MQLQPKRQPGRTDRKAAAYASQVLRLRAEGYTYEAIGEALAEVGIQVSTSTLRREVHWRQREAFNPSSSPGPKLNPRAAVPPTNLARSSPPSSARLLPPGSSGREIAEAFFTTHPSNPLLRSKESS